MAKGKSRGDVKRAQEEVAKAKVIDGLFPRWDIDNSGTIELHELKAVFEELPQHNNAQQTAKQSLSTFLGTNGWAETEEKELGRPEFQAFLQHWVKDLEMQEFLDVMTHLDRAVDAIHAKQRGRRQRLSYNLFQMWDVDQSGTLEFSELEAVLADTTCWKKGKSFNTKILEFTPKQFHRFMEELTSGLDDDGFEYFVQDIQERLKASIESKKLVRSKASSEDIATVDVAEEKEVTDSQSDDEAPSKSLDLPDSVDAAPIGITEKAGRSSVIASMFCHWDLNCNGVVELTELDDIISYLSSEAKAISKKVVQRAAARLRDQPVHGWDVNTFTEVMLGVTKSLPDDQFSRFVLQMKEALLDMARLAEGRRRRAFWELFHKYDVDESGSIDVDELQQLLSMSPTLMEDKNIRKKIASWMAALRQSQALKAQWKELKLADFQDLMKDFTSTLTNDQFRLLIKEMETNWNTRQSADTGSYEITHEESDTNARAAMINSLFSKFDLNGSNTIEHSEIQHVVSAIKQCCQLEPEFAAGLDEWVVNVKAGPNRLGPYDFLKAVGTFTDGMSTRGFQYFVDSADEACKYLSTMLSGRQKMCVWELFNAIDINKDGILDLQEVQTMISKLTPFGALSETKQLLEDSGLTFFNRATKNSDGIMSLTLFHHWVADLLSRWPEAEWHVHLEEMLLLVLGESLNSASAFMKGSGLYIKHKRTSVEASPSQPTEAEAIKENPPGTETVVPEGPEFQNSAADKDSVVIKGIARPSPSRTPKAPGHAQALLNKYFPVHDVVDDDEMRPELRSQVRHSLDGIYDEDVIELEALTKRDLLKFYPACEAACWLLRYMPPDQTPTQHECWEIVKNRAQDDGALLDHMRGFNPRKASKKAVQSVLPLYHLLPPSQFLPYGKVAAGLCAWIRAITAYVLFTNPHWQLEIPPKPERPGTPPLIAAPEVPRPNSVSCKAPGFPPHILNAGLRNSSEVVGLPSLKGSTPNTMGAADTLVSREPLYEHGPIQPLEGADFVSKSPQKTVAAVNRSAIRRLPNVSQPRPAPNQKKYLIEKPVTSELSPYLRRMDVSGVLLAPEDLRLQFQAIDVDGQGWIFKEDFCDLYHEMDLCEEEMPLYFQSLIKSCKTWGPDKLSFQEFSLLMLKLAQW